MELHVSKFTEIYNTLSPEERVNIVNFSPSLSTQLRSFSFSSLNKISFLENFFFSIR